MNRTGSSVLRRALLSLPIIPPILAATTQSGHTATSATSDDAFDSILSRNRIHIGIIVDFPPFGFLDANHEPDGFDVDFSRMLANALGVRLTLVQCGEANRVPFLKLKEGGILLVADLGITPGRAKEVMFTIPYAATRSIVYAPKGRTIRELSDLVGLRVATARGSSNDIFLTEAAPTGVRIARFDSEALATQALLSGQVDAMVESDTDIANLLRRAPGDRSKLTEQFVLATQANALAVRQTDFKLHQYLNTFVYYAKATGKLDALYRKWLHAPLPELPTF